jgi:hypothetical protein
VVLGWTFVDLVEAKQLLGHTSGVHKVKSAVEVQPRRLLDTMAGERNKAAGEGNSKLAMEGAQFMEITTGDHAMQQMKITTGDHAMQQMKIMLGNHAMQQMKILEPHSKEDFTRGLKEILISLQKEIASCLYKLEMGCESEERPGHSQPNQVKGGPSNQVDPGSAQPSNVLESVDKPTRQQLINRYHRIYVCRHSPRRQILWRSKLVG